MLTSQKCLDLKMEANERKGGYAPVYIHSRLGRLQPLDPHFVFPVVQIMSETRNLKHSIEITKRKNVDLTCQLAIALHM